MKKIYIEETKDYSKFKKLMGNRDITNKRVGIIKKSIQEYGYISNPIIVNEHMEVIDGQGRLEALTQLDMPVEYRVIPGIGINECRAMNLKPTAWTNNDYVRSYAEMGNENYIRLEMIIKETGYQMYKVLYLLTCSIGAGCANMAQMVRSGNIKITQKDYERVIELSKTLNTMTDSINAIGGRTIVTLTCLGWIIQQKDVDIARLKKSLETKTNMIHSAADAKQMLEEISEVYNKGYAKGRRDFYYEYKKSIGMI